MIISLSRSRLDRSRPMRDQIYPLVRRMILTGAIKPGEVIDEKAIAAQLNVSRTPVREAVKKLSDENLVEVVAQSGTRAARIAQGRDCRGLSHPPRAWNQRVRRRPQRA